MDYFCSQEELLHFWAYSPPHFDFIAAAGSTLDDVDVDVEVEAPSQQLLSSFVRYSGPSSCCVSEGNCGGERNIHRRMIQFLRKIQKPKPKPKSKKNEGSREFRHMMRERQRREKLSQSYADLYSILVPRSKADKNSIVKAAAVNVKELRKAKEKLWRRNDELRARIARINERAAAAEGEGDNKVRIRLGKPTTALDGMIGALKCLKGMDVKATAVRSGFAGGELNAFVTVETEVRKTCEIERAVQGAVADVERKLRWHSVQGPIYSHGSQSEEYLS